MTYRQWNATINQTKVALTCSFNAGPQFLFRLNQVFNYSALCGLCRNFDSTITTFSVAMIRWSAITVGLRYIMSRVRRLEFAVETLDPVKGRRDTTCVSNECPLTFTVRTVDISLKGLQNYEYRSICQQSKVALVTLVYGMFSSTITGCTKYVTPTSVPVEIKDAARRDIRSSASGSNSNGGSMPDQTQSTPTQGIMTVDGSLDARLGKVLSSSWECRTCKLTAYSNRYSVSIDDQNSPAIQADWLITINEPIETTPCFNNMHDWQNVTPGAAYIRVPKYTYDWRGDYARKF